MKKYKIKNNCGSFDVEISKAENDTIIRSNMNAPGSCSRYYSTADRLSYDLNFNNSSEKELIDKYEIKSCTKGDKGCSKLLAILLKEYLLEN